MKRSKPIVWALVAGLALLSSVPAFDATVAQEAASQAPMLLPVDATPLRIERDGKEIAEFSVEIADDPVERSRGLMFRTEFPGNRAMLFVFERTREVAFWMKNTPRPLDLLFVAEDGELTSIARNATPFSIASIPSDGPVRYVVEINAGVSAMLGLKPGDRIVHPVISGDGK